MLNLSLVRRRQPSVVLGINRVVLLSIACYVTPSVCRGGTPELRGAARDAPNAAWLLASLNCDPTMARAIPIPPSGSFQDSTFDQVKTLSDSMGVKAELRRLTYSDLCSLHGPSIVFLRRGPQETGYFAVVLHAVQGQVTAINAGWMTVAVYPEDEFRLRWTGHALVPQPGGRIPYALAVPLFVLGLIVPPVFQKGYRLCSIL
jgi:hypothetical protein